MKKNENNCCRVKEAVLAENIIKIWKKLFQHGEQTHFKFYEKIRDHWKFIGKENGIIPFLMQSPNYAARGTENLNKK